MCAEGSDSDAEGAESFPEGEAPSVSGSVSFVEETEETDEVQTMY